MKTADATAEVFLTAFEALPKSQREAVLQHLFANPTLKEDLIDVARWYERRAERPVPYERVRQNMKKAGRLWPIVWSSSQLPVRNWNGSTIRCCAGSMQRYSS